MNILNVFMVDDHPIILDGYKSILKILVSDLQFNVIEAHDCKTAFEEISDKKNNFDLALIDWSIPPYEDEDMFSGEDIATLIQSKMPYCKLIIITSFSEIVFVEKVLNTINPDGFLIKNESGSADFAACVKTVLQNKKYYSSTVQNYVERPIKYYELDSIDLVILEKLSKGIKTNNLTNYIDLSISAIEKRKARIKFKLDVDGNDENLLITARKLGLV